MVVNVYMWTEKIPGEDLGYVFKFHLKYIVWRPEEIENMEHKKQRKIHKFLGMMTE